MNRSRNNFSRPRAVAIAIATITLVLLPNGVHSCTNEQATELGCDEILTVGYGGQSDWIFLDSSTYNYTVTNKLCVPAGSYSAISLHYIEGTDTAPVTIINCGGQVILDGQNSGINNDAEWNTFTGKGTRFIHLSGNGDPSFEYGFVMHGAKNHGVHFDEGCSDIEINNVETYDNDYGGIVVRTYPRCDGRCSTNAGSPTYNRNCTRGEFVQENTIVHDNYVHDTPGEGMYIGTSHFYKDEDGNSMCSGETWPQPELKGVHIHNNRIEDTGRDGIQVGSAVEDVTVHHNSIKRFAYKQDYGDANAIGMNPGSMGNVYNNWIEGKLRSIGDGEEYFGIVYHGQAADNTVSRIYNNVVLNVNNAFMFLNREDAVGQRYEFAYNTVHNFTGISPIKLYCSGTDADTPIQPISNITVRNNIFSMGPNEDLSRIGGQSRFYGNGGRECLNYEDTFASNIFDFDLTAFFPGAIYSGVTINFVDPVNLDFHIQESSPAKDTAVALSNNPPIGVDYDEVVRASPKDQGAYTAEPATTTTTVPTTTTPTITTCDMEVQLHVVDQTRSTCNGNKVSCKVDITNSNVDTYMHDLQVRVVEVNQEYTAQDAEQHFNPASPGFGMASGSNHDGCLTYPEPNTGMMNVAIVCGTFKLNNEWICSSSEDLSTYVDQSPKLEFMTLTQGGGSSSNPNSITRPAKSKRAKGSGGFKRRLQQEEEDGDLTVTFPQDWVWDTNEELFYPMILSSAAIWEVDACLLLPPGHELVAVMDVNSTEILPLEGQCTHIVGAGDYYEIVLLFQVIDDDSPWGTRALRNKKARDVDIHGHIKATEGGSKKKKTKEIDFLTAVRRKKVKGKL